MVPLQEGKLLSGLVNKLGDPSRKIASKAGYLLSSLLQEHPAMKVVVVSEVQRFMFRQGLQERARYYGVVFLNQMVLSHNASQGGVHIHKLSFSGSCCSSIDLFFSSFVILLQQYGGFGLLGRSKDLRRANLPCQCTTLRLRP